MRGCQYIHSSFTIMDKVLDDLVLSVSYEFKFDDEDKSLLRLFPDLLVDSFE